MSPLCRRSPSLTACAAARAGMDASGGRRQSTDSSRLSVDSCYRMSGDFGPGADYSARASFESMQARPCPRAQRAVRQRSALRARFASDPFRTGPWYMLGLSMS